MLGIGTPTLRQTNAAVPETDAEKLSGGLVMLAGATVMKHFQVNDCSVGKCDVITICSYNSFFLLPIFEGNHNSTKILYT